MGPQLDIRSSGSFQETMQSDPEFWALRINAAWRRSLEAVIETGRLLIDAKVRLKHGQWAALVDTQLDFSADTAERLMAIARDERLSNPAHVRILPRSYSTLHALTKCTNEQFDRGVREKIINPDMERKDVELIRPTPHRARAESSDGGGESRPAPEGSATVAASGLRERHPRDLEAAGSQSEAETGWSPDMARAMELASDRESQDSDLIAGPSAERGRAGVAPGPSETTMPGGGLSIAHSRVEPSDSLDFFPTPPWATRALFERVLPHLERAGHCKFQKARDPCCGAGHMSEVMREYFSEVLASDIGDYDYAYEKADFQQKTPFDAEAVDWFIMNSPFGSLAEDFCLKSIELAGVGVAMFVRLQWLETPGRYERIYKNNPPSVVAVFTERVPIHKGRWVFNGKTMTAYVWLLWIKGMPPQPLFFIPPGCREALTKPDDAARFGAVWEDDEGNQYPSYEAFVQATRNTAPAAEAAE